MTDVKMADAGSKTIVEKKAEGSEAEQDLYIRMKELENELQMLQIQENYLKDEQRHLKSEYVRSKDEVSAYQSTPSLITLFLFFIDQASSVSLPRNWQLR